MGSSTVVFNHFGHCVTDLDRASVFYCTLFGFTETRRITVPDEPTAQLLGVDRPVNLHAAYLDKDGTVLELILFDRDGNPASRRRPFNEPGLTHMSFCVEDLADTCRQAVDLGGSVVEGTDVGLAVMILDPDGQPIELLPMSYRASIAQQA